MGDVAQQPEPGPGPVPTSPCSPGHSLLWDRQSWKEERTMLATSERSVLASVGVMAQGLGWGRPEGADHAGQGSWGEDCSPRSLRAQCRGEGPPELGCVLHLPRRSSAVHLFPASLP